MGVKRRGEFRTRGGVYSRRVFVEQAYTGSLLRELRLKILRDSGGIGKSRLV